MGGTICVGVRRSDGTETIYHRWTNPLPLYFIDPRFRHEDNEFLKRFHEDGATSEYGGVQTKILPVSYGIILVDFITKSVFSRQGYCSFGNASISGLSIQDADDYNMLYLLATRPEEVTIYDGKNLQTLDEATKRKTLDIIVDTYKDVLFADIADEALPELHLPYYRATATYPFTVDADGDGINKANWHTMCKWVQEREWKTPLASEKEVAEHVYWDEDEEY